MPNETRALAEAERICHAADGILRLAEESYANLGAVNWGDLQVVDVIECRGLDGTEWTQVLIEEASPDCRLGSYVHERLTPLFPGRSIEVRTEW